MILNQLIFIVTFKLMGHTTKAGKILLLLITSIIKDLLRMALVQIGKITPHYNYKHLLLTLFLTRCMLGTERMIFAPINTRA